MYIIIKNDKEQLRYIYIIVLKQRKEEWNNELEEVNKKIRFDIMNGQYEFIR